MPWAHLLCIRGDEMSVLKKGEELPLEELNKKDE